MLADMCLKLNGVMFVLFIITRSTYCELSPEAMNLLQEYSNNVNSSISLSKNDKNLLNSWNEEFQIKRVNITTKFRVQMTRHKEHSFRRTYNNKKWLQCMDIYRTEISTSDLSYFENESSCLKNANTEDKEKNNAVNQVEREIKRWRRSYKYLFHLCSIKHPDDKDSAGLCLVEYIERDNYNSTLQRLMVMKLEAIRELYLRLTYSMAHLEDCLKTNLSLYLNMIRSVMEKLNRCYRNHNL